MYSTVCPIAPPPPTANFTRPEFSSQGKIAYTIANCIQSAVSIFAFQCVISLSTFLMLTCVERVFSLLERFGGAQEHYHKLRDVLNVRAGALKRSLERVYQVLERLGVAIESDNVGDKFFVICTFMASFPVAIHSEYYMFVNHRLFSLPADESFARLLYLPAWLATFAADLMVQLLDARLRFATLQSKHWQSSLCLVPAGLLLLVAATGSWLALITWPEEELSLWRRFWRTLLTIQQLELVIASLVPLASIAALRFSSKRFIHMQTLIDSVRVAIWTTLLFMKLRVYMQSISAGEWGAGTLFVLLGSSSWFIFIVCKFVYDLYKLPQILRLQLAREQEAEFFERVRAQQEKCPICLEAFTSAAMHKVVNTPCRHYFHTRCLMAWFLEDARRRCPICRTAMDSS